jgi:hypothetical protein
MSPMLLKWFNLTYEYMTKFLKLVFRNAGVFYNRDFYDSRKSGRTQDYVVLGGNNGCKKRVDYHQNFKEPITVYQVSNVIHVLFGERPVSSFREVYHERIDYLFNKALDSLMIIDNYSRKCDRFVDREYVKETVMTKKSVHNSHSPSLDMNWFKVKLFLSDDNLPINLYEFFITESSRVFDIDVTKISFKELKELYMSVDKDEINHIIDVLKKYLKTPIVNYLINEGYDNSINQNYISGLKRTVNNGLYHVYRLSGTIYVPITKDDIDRLREVSTGVCTLLDGGMVYIDSIIEDFELDHIDNYIKIKDLSTEKIDYNETKN